MNVLKHIIKINAPASLEAYKNTEGARFDDMPQNVKDELRNSLVEEQGGLCCYCGGEIKADHTSVIEHLLPKGDERYAHLQLEYTNLLCSCDGGESDRKGKSKKQKRLYPSHCDDKKHDDIIGVSPLDKNCEEQFAYDEEGHIIGKSTTAEETIETLGLNCSTLSNKRKGAIDAYADLDPYETNWDEIIQSLGERHDGRFIQYCFVSIYYIKNYKMMQV